MRKFILAFVLLIAVVMAGYRLPVMITTSLLLVLPVILVMLWLAAHFKYIRNAESAKSAKEITSILLVVILFAWSIIYIHLLPLILSLAWVVLFILSRRKIKAVEIARKLILVTLTCFAIGWAFINLDLSIVVSGTFGKIENGSAFDKAFIDITDYKKIIIPNNARVLREGIGSVLGIFMKKKLSFVGHPSESMSIRQARKHMGCAVKTDNCSLIIATYGEWDSMCEGGAHMNVLFVVPHNIVIEKKDGLSGPYSEGREWYGEYLTKPKEVKEGYWYGPASPAQGWKAIPDMPDMYHKANPDR